MKRWKHSSLLFQINFLDVLCMFILFTRVINPPRFAQTLRHIFILLFCLSFSPHACSVWHSCELLCWASGIGPGAGKYSFRGCTGVSSPDPWCTGLLFSSLVSSTKGFCSASKSAPFSSSSFMLWFPHSLFIKDLPSALQQLTFLSLCHAAPAFCVNYTLFTLWLLIYICLNLFYPNLRLLGLNFACNALLTDLLVHSSQVCASYLFIWASCLF